MLKKLSITCLAIALVFLLSVSSQATTFVPLDFSGPIPKSGDGTLAGTILLNDIIYPGGTFDLIWLGSWGAEQTPAWLGITQPVNPTDSKPVGDSVGTFNIGAKGPGNTTGPGFPGGPFPYYESVRITFTGVAPIIQITNPVNPTVSGGNYAGSDDKWTVAANAGTWTVVDSLLNDLNVLSNVGSTVIWSYPGGTTDVLSRNRDWSITSLGGVSQLDLLFQNINTNIDNSNTIRILVPEVPVVPEPATMLLLGSGLIGLAGFARRKFKK